MTTKASLHLIYLLSMLCIAPLNQSQAYAHLPVKSSAIRQLTIMSASDNELANFFYTNIQIVEIKNSIAYAYLDVHSFLNSGKSVDDLNSTLLKLSENLQDMLSFFTDKPVDEIELQVIRITSIDEYNVGSGYKKLGLAKFKIELGAWKMTFVSINEK